MVCLSWVGVSIKIPQLRDRVARFPVFWYVILPIFQTDKEPLQLFVVVVSLFPWMDSYHLSLVVYLMLLRTSQPNSWLILEKRTLRLVKFSCLFRMRGRMDLNCLCLSLYYSVYSNLWLLDCCQRVRRGHSTALQVNDTIICYLEFVLFIWWHFLCSCICSYFSF